MKGLQASIELSAGRQLVWLKAQRPILLIFLLACLLRAAPNIWLEWHEPGWHASHINEIEFYYDDVARSLILGEGFVHSIDPRDSNSEYNFKPGTPFHFVPPLYAWLLGIEYFLFGPNVFIAKLVQCLLDSFVCVLIFQIGVRTLDRTTGLIGAALYATYPLAIHTSTVLYYQTPLNLALCWLILCLGAPATVKNGIWTGVAVGISALAKPITLPFIVLLPAIRILENVGNKATTKCSLLWSLFFALAFVLTLAPWTIRNYYVFGRFVPVQNGAESVLIQGSKEEYVDLDVTSLRRKYGKDFKLSADRVVSTGIANHLNHLKSNPLDYLRFLIKKFFLAWYNTEGKDKNAMALLIQLPFLSLALIGLTTSLSLWMRRPNWYIVGLILYVCGVQVLLFPLVRYTVAVMPLVMLPAAMGIKTVLRRCGVLQDS